jgi:hypothetical protein
VTAAATAQFSAEICNSGFQLGNDMSDRFLSGGNAP